MAHKPLRREYQQARHTSSSWWVLSIQKVLTRLPYIRLTHPFHVLVVLVALQQLKAAFPITHLSSCGQSSALAPRRRFLAAFRPFLRGGREHRSPDEIGLKRRGRAKSSCGLSDRGRLPRYAVRLFSLPSIRALVLPLPMFLGSTLLPHPRYSHHKSHKPRTVSRYRTLFPSHDPPSLLFQAVTDCQTLHLASLSSSPSYLISASHSLSGWPFLARPFELIFLIPPFYLDISHLPLYDISHTNSRFP